jgi:hypothetical protein
VCTLDVLTRPVPRPGCVHAPDRPHPDHVVRPWGPAVLYAGIPGWCLLILVGVSVLLVIAQVTVTQIIRLRASSRDAVRVLEIEAPRAATTNQNSCRAHD